MSKQQRKYNLGIAGEYFVTAELIRRGISASMTYGNAKKADVVAFSPEQSKCAVIEVKTTGAKRWMLGKEPESNSLIWIFVLLEGTDSPRYFIMTGKQLNEVLAPENIAYEKRYFEKHGKARTMKQRAAGVWSLKYALAEPYENNWEIIESKFGG